MAIFGSNFANGDTLTFGFPEGGGINSNPAKLTVIDSGHITYQINNGSDSGTWTVRVNSADNSQHSNVFSFTVQ